MRYSAEPLYEHGSMPKIGILLVNLGTPEAPTAPAVRAYLKEFLSDPRVVELPRAAWWLILNGIILNIRPRKSAEKYAKIWTSDGSPLRIHTKRQAQLLRGYLGKSISSQLVVEWGMRYGTPSLAEKLWLLREQCCDRVLIIPLYPQYSASTTASSFDAVAAVLSRMRNVPALRLVKHFQDHVGYIQALAQSVKDYWVTNGRPDKLVMSFHGVPRFTLDRGDPYHCECQKTARLLAEALALKPDQHLTTFQSRFGRAEWLKPYTMDTLRRLGKQGLKRVDVVCPGFVSDCLETLEEIGIENKTVFLRAGGGEFHYIPCLNERNDWIRALTSIALENLQGWLSPSGEAPPANQDGESSRQRALAAGARD